MATRNRNGWRGFLIRRGDDSPRRWAEALDLIDKETRRQSQMGLFNSPVRDTVWQSLRATSDDRQRLAFVLAYRLLADRLGREIDETYAVELATLTMSTARDLVAFRALIFTKQGGAATLLRSIAQREGRKKAAERRSGYPLVEQLVEPVRSRVANDAEAPVAGEALARPADSTVRELGVVAGD